MAPLQRFAAALSSESQRALRYRAECMAIRVHSVVLLTACVEAGGEDESLLMEKARWGQLVYRSVRRPVGRGLM